MRNTKRGKRYLVLFLVFSLVITTCIANSSVPVSQAKKKKQTITILNKKKKGVLTIRAGKKVQLKVKVNGKKVPRFIGFVAKATAIPPHLVYTCFQLPQDIVRKF